MKVDRAALLAELLPARTPPLWAPLLTPFAPAEQGGARPAVDVARLDAHLDDLAAHVPLWMLAGSTGDGWELDQAQFETLVEASTRESFVRRGGRVLVAALRPRTEDVLARIATIREIAGLTDAGSVEESLPRLRELGWVGLCVCPPVGASMTQAEIEQHYEAVLEAARLPLALYQLPQVTGCRIEPDTFRRLTARHPEIVLFKDSSGEDAVARAAGPACEPLLVRGAEGQYVDSLRPAGGPYDGLLLSTANTLAPELRALVTATLGGELVRAREISASVGAFVEDLFRAVAGLPTANPFANANRALDHLRAHGADWIEVAPPLLPDGSSLPREAVQAVSKLVAERGGLPARGYLLG